MGPQKSRFSKIPEKVILENHNKAYYTVPENSISSEGPINYNKNQKSRSFFKTWFFRSLKHYNSIYEGTSQQHYNERIDEEFSNTVFVFGPSQNDDFSNAVYFKDWIKSLFNARSLSQPKLSLSFEKITLRPTYVILPENTDGKKFGTIVHIGIKPPANAMHSNNKTLEQPHDSKKDVHANSNDQNIQDPPKNNQNSSSQIISENARRNRRNNEPEFKNTKVNVTNENPNKIRVKNPKPPQSDKPKPDLNSKTEQQVKDKTPTRIPKNNQSKEAISNTLNIDSNTHSRRELRDEPELNNIKINTIKNNTTLNDSTNTAQQVEPKLNSLDTNINQESKTDDSKPTKINKEIIQSQNNFPAQIANADSNKAESTTPENQPNEINNPNSRKNQRNSEQEFKNTKVHVVQNNGSNNQTNSPNTSPDNTINNNNNTTQQHEHKLNNLDTNINQESKTDDNKPTEVNKEIIQNQNNTPAQIKNDSSNKTESTTPANQSNKINSPNSRKNRRNSEQEFKNTKVHVVQNNGSNNQTNSPNASPGNTKINKNTNKTQQHEHKLNNLDTNINQESKTDDNKLTKANKEIILNQNNTPAQTKNDSSNKTESTTPANQSNKINSPNSRKNRRNSEQEFKNTKVHVVQKNGSSNQTNSPNASIDNTDVNNNTNKTQQYEHKLNNLDTNVNQESKTDDSKPTKVNKETIQSENKIPAQTENADSKKAESTTPDIQTNSPNSRKNRRKNEQEFKNTKVHVVKKNGLTPQGNDNKTTSSNSAEKNITTQPEQPELNTLNTNNHQDNKSTDTKQTPEQLKYTNPEKEKHRTPESQPKILNNQNSRKVRRNNEPELKNTKVHVVQKNQRNLNTQEPNSNPSAKNKKDSISNTKQTGLNSLNLNKKKAQETKINNHKESNLNSIDKTIEKRAKKTKDSRSIDKVSLEPRVSIEQSPHTYEIDQNSNQYKRKKESSFKNTRVTVKRNHKHPKQ